MQSEPSGSVTSSILSPRQASAESTRIFDQLPEASIVSVSRPDPDNISPALLSYTIEIQYKQVPMRSLFLSNFLLMLENFFKLYKLIDRIQTNLESRKS